MKKVLIIFGGVSSEYDVSLVSAKCVIEKIDKTKYEVIQLGITRDGRWFKYNGHYENLPEDNWLKDDNLLEKAMISIDRLESGLTVFGKNGVENISIDIAFPVLHGRNGEDGTMQGLLQLAGIPFVGCDALSSAMCMDKAITNTIMDSICMKQAKWQSFLRFEYEQNGADILEKAEKELGFPIFIKPANAGSSVGITKAKSMDMLKSGIETAFKHDCKIVLEESIDGFEVECAILGNENPIASVVGEVIPCHEFYDYEAKYLDDSMLLIPASIDADKQEDIRNLARKAFMALGCSGLSRVDFFVEKSSGEIYFNEINTIPGFTAISMYSKLFGNYGISYSELIDKLLVFAQEKWKGKGL